jgi:HD superfamily phosphohydrolase
MIQFSDLLYGRIELPRWLGGFLRIPEFVRLRGVRLSNVDSIDFKDFGSANRWEHGIGVAYLAWRCGEYRQLSTQQRAELTLAALLHDVATPPFAHTAESVLEGFSHELETQRVLSAVPTDSSSPDMPVFGSSLPQFQSSVRKLQKDAGIKVDADEVARMVIGEGELGFLISGTLDLDNADNVTRGCSQMGMDVDRLLPLRIVKWLAKQNCAPTDLANQDEPAVQEWLEYRNRYYSAFYNSSEQELGRQAFLQHLMRRAVKEGLSRRSLIWNTDDGLLNTIAGIEERKTSSRRASLSELVERYRLIEPTERIFEVELEDEEEVRILRQPTSISWLEEHLSSPTLEVLLFVSTRRFVEHEKNSLFPSTFCGALIAFKLGEDIHYRQLPSWLRTRIPSDLKSGRLKRMLSEAVASEIPGWTKERPWFSMSQGRKDSVVENLRSAGDWSFRLSRNENLHTYPSTYVHAIPASLINCLGLRGDLILDPFGGTGQTACEAIKYECNAITADSNTIATLIARARLTPLSLGQRDRLRSLSIDELYSAEPCAPPEFEAAGKWHDPKTLRQLCTIRSFVQSLQDDRVRQFLLVCFSAIITASTARRGKEHGFFADNTPLPADLKKPPYINAVDLFLARVQKNLEILSRLYGFMERTGRDPHKELERARVFQLDACSAKPQDYGVAPNSVGAIITSPPYLCMADYSLGQRLSYYWIAPDALQHDFGREIGARRQRSQPKKAAERYFSSIEQFARNAALLLRSGGFLATVLGSPVARSFKEMKVIEKIDEILRGAGFDLLWDRTRPIHWHRNQGYQRLLKERVSVHVRR